MVRFVGQRRKVPAQVTQVKWTQEPPKVPLHVELSLVTPYDIPLSTLFAFYSMSEFVGTGIFLFCQVCFTLSDMV